MRRRLEIAVTEAGGPGREGVPAGCGILATVAMVRGGFRSPASGTCVKIQQAIEAAAGVGHRSAR